MEMDNRPKRKDVYQIPFEDLVLIEGFNVRYDYGDLEGLALSIESNGVKVPLRGYKNKDGKYCVTDGHRRYKALNILADKGIQILAPFITETKDYNDEKRTLDLVITNDGKGLTILEESEVYQRLINFGWSQTEISTKTGKSLTHIGNCVLLMTASTKTKKFIRDGKVSSSLVIDELKIVSVGQVEVRVSQALSRTGKSKVTNRDIKSDDKSEPPKLGLKSLKKLYIKLESSEVGAWSLDVVYHLQRYFSGHITYDELLKKLT